ncbi:MAG: amidohydrolase family protein, partial [Rickettsiales bacterium]
MSAATKWIDTHVHIFPQTDEKAELPRLIRQNNVVNTPANYRAGNANNKPSGVVVVHFSKAADSKHVIASLDEMKSAGCRLPKAGVIKADVSLPETYDWILRDDVAGVRVYAKEAPCDFSDKAAWDRLWNLVRSQKKHVLVFGSAPHLRPTIAQIPQDLTLVIDHLGLPDATQGGNDAEFNALLADMVSRNKTAG